MRYVLGRVSPHPSSQRGYLKALTHWFAFLVKQGLRKDNPARAIGRPPEPRRFPRPLSLQECTRYLMAARSLGVFPEALATIGLYEGLRKSEIRTLQWSRMFKAGNRIWLDVLGKGSREGRIPLHPMTVRVLRKVRQAHNDAVWVFPSPTRPGYPISGGPIVDWHARICEEAALENVTLHQLRHSHATWMHKIGADGAIVQRSLRHANFSSTLFYMDVLDDELGDWKDRLNFEGGDKREAR